MDIVNESGLESAWIVSQIEPPAFALAVMVKGTFQLLPNQPALLAEEQLPLTGDEFEAGDSARLFRYPHDFAPFKPRTDVLLQGTCYQFASQPRESAQVGLHVGPISKTLLVTGNRIWTSRREFSRPELFRSMPLTWERAFGGPGFAANPLGKGFVAIESPDGKTVHPLPNIEATGGRVRNSSETPESAGFGPIPDTWPQRLKKFGSMNDRYLKERWPWYPHDIDWGYFNTAPQDQQVEGYLKGNEEFILQNLHPTINDYHARLPGLRVHVFLIEQVRAREKLREIPMHLDTLWLDMDEEKLILVWRGHVPVRSEKLLEVIHQFIIVEPISRKPGSLEEYHLMLLDALERREAEDEELEEEEAEEEEVEDEEEETEEETIAEVPAEESAVPPPAATADDENEETEAVESENEEEVPDDEDALTEERVKEMIAQRQSFVGCDLSSLELNGLDFSGLDMHDSILEEAVLFQANLSGTNLAAAVLTGANLRETKCMGTNFTEADLTETRLVQADLSGANLTGADLSRAHLRGANLQGVKAAESIFVEADLSDANFEDADLSASDLCGSRLHRTNFSRANLSDAALENAWGRHVKAPGANLHKVRGAKAVLSEADFSDTTGVETVFEAADLYAANFSRATLNQAEFSGAYLAEAVFDCATVKEARFNEANLRCARMVRCNLYESSLEKADLTHANLNESNLFGATLMDAVIEKTNFKGANLRRIKNRQEIKNA